MKLHWFCQHISPKLLLVLSIAHINMSGLPFVPYHWLETSLKWKTCLNRFLLNLENGGKIPVWYSKERCLSFTDKTQVENLSCWKYLNCRHLWQSFKHFTYWSKHFQLKILKDPPISGSVCVPSSKSAIFSFHIERMNKRAIMHLFKISVLCSTLLVEQFMGFALLL